MPTPSKAAPRAASTPGHSSATPDGASPPQGKRHGPSPLITVVWAWLIPGAGHLLQGQGRKAVVFGVVLMAMFAIGLASSGRLFPFDSSQPLVLLAAGAEWMLGLPRLAAAVGGWGRGEVTAITFEYGNTFLIAAGLLNILVVLDAFDRASGRKPTREVK
jgi:hypothetical protein